MSLASRTYEVAYHDTPVREFHEVFDHPVSYNPHVVPSIENRVLRIRMIAEELLETARALGVHLSITHGITEADDVVSASATSEWSYDPVEAADGFGDIRYLVDGGNLLCGFPGDLVLAEIHRSNMSKTGADGKPVRREDGKILKGPNYFKPDIRKILFGGAVNPPSACTDERPCVPCYSDQGACVEAAVTSGFLQTR